MSEKKYQGIYEPKPIAAQITAVCPSKVSLPVFSKEAHDVWSEEYQGKALHDVWELVNTGQEFIGVRLCQGVTKEEVDILIEEREKNGIQTQRFLSHRDF